MISGFRKPKRSGNIRKKVVTEVDDDGNGSHADRSNFGNEIENSASLQEVQKVRVKDKSKKSGKPKGLLSFGEEIDTGDEFQVKKSKESKMLARRLESEKKMKKKRQEVSNETVPLVADKAETYQNEKIQPDSDRTLLLVDDRYSRDATKLPVNAENLDSDSSNACLPQIKAGLSSGLIPDAATIFAVKKRREQARQLGGADFIPVVTKETTKYEGRFTNSHSRLIREEDDDDSDEDRMEFKGNSTKSFPALERRSQVAQALEEAQDDEVNDHDEEDELALWEKEQIKKGTGIPAGQAEASYGPQIPPDYAVPSQIEVPIVTPDQYFGSLPRPPLPPGIPVSIANLPMVPQGLALPQSILGAHDTQIVSVEMVSQRLSERLSSLLQLHRAHNLEKEKLENDIQSSKSNIISLEQNSSEVSEKFSFFQDLSGYIRDFVDCLNEKIIKINECEKLIHLLWRVRAEKMLQRRIDDTKDQDAEILGKSPKYASSLDDFNQNKSEFQENSRKRRIAEREGRRNRRRRQREKTLSSEEVSKYNEGLSSDDEELDADVIRFNEDKEKVLSKSKAIFEDVIEDFSSVSEVQSRFIQWRLGFADSYKEAYADLTLPKVIGPFIRLELLSWNPLEENSLRLEDMEWYCTLKQFGDYRGKSNDDDNENQNRLAIVTEKLLIPKMCVFIESVWDPFSKKQTDRLVNCVTNILDRHPSLTDKSTEKQELMSSIVTRLRQVSETGIYLPLYGKSLIENRSSEALVFLKRQFWSALKFLKNALMWNGVLSTKELQELSFDSILNRYLLAALQQFPNYHENSEICKTVVSLFPKTWFESNNEAIPPGLEPFSRYLSGLAAGIYRASLGFSSQEKKKAKMATKRIISLLLHMHAFELARSVAAEYKYDV